MRCVTNGFQGVVEHPFKRRAHGLRAAAHLGEGPDGLVANPSRGVMERVDQSRDHETRIGTDLTQGHGGAYAHLHRGAARDPRGGAPVMRADARSIQPDE